MAGGSQLALVGRTLARYRIVESLGRGGMGEVFVAEDTDLGRRVALKVLAPGRAIDDSRLSRFRREARALAGLSHPGIVSIHTFENVDGLHFLTMELVEGKTVAELVSRDGLPLTRIFQIAIPLADALVAAHERGIIHRDLKPSNLMLARDGRLKILDFGLAKLLAPPSDSTAETLDELTRENVIVGTVPYMSPEQLRGGEVDARSDIYAVGLILHELATGSLPATATDRAGEPPSTDELRPDLPHHLARIIRRCLEPDPGHRYQVTRDLLNDLVDLRRESTTVSDADQPGPPPRRLLRRWRLVAAAALVLLVAAVGAWLTERLGRGREAGPMRLSALATGPAAATHSRISPDGQWISLAGTVAERSELWLQRAAGAGERVVVASPEGFVESHVWSPDGEEIAMVVRREEETLLQTLPAFGGPPSRSLALSQDEGVPSLVRWLDSGLFVRDRAGLQLLDLESGDWHRLLDARFPGGNRFDFDVRPDGRRVAFCVGAGDEVSLWTADLDGGNPRRLTGGAFSVYRPRWIGPAASSLVYSSNESGQADLWRMSVAEGTARQVTFSGDVEIVEDAALDGSLLTFRQYHEASDLWALAPGAAGAARLTGVDLQDFWVSAAGDRVAFQRSKAQLERSLGFLEGDLFLARLGGGSLEELRPAVADGAVPLLAPGGRTLAFVRASGAAWALWARDLSSGREIQVTARYKIPSIYVQPRDFDRTNAAWNATGATLYFVAFADTRGEEIRTFSPAASSSGSERLLGSTEWSYGDLHPSPAGHRLAYVRSDPAAPARQEIVALDLDSGQSRTLLARGGGWGELYLAGWRADGGAVIAADATPNLDWTESLEVLEIELSGGRRTLGTVARAFGGNAVLDGAAGALVLIGSEAEGRPHNLYRLFLADGRLRRLTDNSDSRVSFSGLGLAADGALLYSRQEARESTWMVHFDEPDRRSERR